MVDYRRQLGTALRAGGTFALPGLAAKMLLLIPKGFFQFLLLRGLGLLAIAGNETIRFALLKL